MSQKISKYWREMFAAYGEKERNRVTVEVWDGYRWILEGTYYGDEAKEVVYMWKHAGVPDAFIRRSDQNAND